jgi:predicted ArsR family transcriptional regulator
MAGEEKNGGSKIDKVIKKVLSNERVIEGYTITEIADQLGIPFPTARWHLETLESEGSVTFTRIGRAKVFKLREEQSQE